MIVWRESRFHRELLPPARSFYENELGKMGRTSRGWCKALCPFHPDHHPSLSINIDSGAFHCFACGEHGGDILDFLQKRDGLSFKEAAQRLGAWQGATETFEERHERTERETQRKRICVAADRLEFAERELRFRIRSELHSLERVQYAILCRLDALNRGAQENPAEAEICWNSLSLLIDDIRELVAAFYLVVFSAEVPRCAFVLFPERRAGAIRAALDRGGLIDDRSRWMEIPLD